jgi:hypothetical protein
VLVTIYKVVQIWPGQTVTSLHTNSPGHILTTLYINIIIIIGYFPLSFSFHQLRPLTYELWIYSEKNWTLSHLTDNLEERVGGGGAAGGRHNKSSAYKKKTVWSKLRNVRTPQYFRRFALLLLPTSSWIHECYSSILLFLSTATKTIQTALQLRYETTEHKNDYD